MRTTLLPLAAVLALAAPAFAQEDPPRSSSGSEAGAERLPVARTETPAPSPGEIVAQAAPSEWVTIAPEDLLVMTLAPDAAGNERQVVIQLMPPPFSQGWVENIRTLARERWYDGIAVTRVQDNYVVQWGDPNGGDEAKAKPLPVGLNLMDEKDYTLSMPESAMRAALPDESECVLDDSCPNAGYSDARKQMFSILSDDNYAEAVTFLMGWPLGVASDPPAVWPVHCYGMVGVGRGMSPDTGTGAELYTVIGHAPRHLDRNIALVGRVVEGIEHLSSLPRGIGPLGFYEDLEKRVPIESIRVASDLPGAEQPEFVYLSTEGETFARYAEARANRRDPFFITPAGGADICNIPVPVKRVEAGE